MAVVKSQATYPSELALPMAEPVVDTGRAAAPRVPTGRTGVVVVHGIGSQKPAETLLEWTAPLIEVMTAWRTWEPGTGHRSLPPAELERPIDPVKAAAIDFESPFPTLSLHVPEVTTGDRHHAAREWLITEAWWASNVAAPGLSTMITWLGPGGGVGRIVDGILGNEEAGRAAGVLRAFLVPLVSVLAGLFLTVYGALRSITALVPIQALREAAILRQFDEFLIGWFGDVRILLFDPAQSANIRGGLAEAIERLRERCDEIVVVAHSGGAMISYLALTDPELAPRAQVDKLITFGEGWNLALRLTPGGVGMADRLRRDITTMQPGLRWRDFHASHDPAPAGPLAVAEIRPSVADPDRIRSFRVWNRRSVLGDHGGYFDNDEEFTLPLLREIDVPSGWGEDSRFYPPDPDAPPPSIDPEAEPGPRIRRRRQRVAILALWRHAVVTLTVATVALALGWVPERLITIGTDVGSILPRVPVVADAIDVLRDLARGGLDQVTFALPVAGRIEPGAVAGWVEWVGIAVLQGVVIMAGLYLLAAQARAYLAWPQASRVRTAITALEVALTVVVTAAVVSVFVAPSHDRLLGAGFVAWVPGLTITIATGGIALLGTRLADRSRSPFVSNAYAAVATAVFLAALACSALAFMRSAELERAEIAYVAIWIVAFALVSAGSARWAGWDRVERLIAYGPVAGVHVDRRPVIFTSAGFLTIAGSLMALALAGPSVWVVYAALIGIALIGIGASFGAYAWRAYGNPVAAPDAVESARGSV